MISSKEYDYSVESGPLGFAYRPIIPVKLILNEIVFRTEGLIDSGSGDIIINKGIAEAVFKVDFSKCRTIPMGGFGGVGGISYVSKLEIQIDDFDNYKFEIPVLFADFPGALVLGDTFFTKFNVVFERNKSKFKLIKLPVLE